MRSLVLASRLVAALLLVACSEPTSGPSIEATSHVVHLEVPVGMMRDVDVLVVIDDSPAMAAHQAHLVASYAQMIRVLEQQPGGLPDLHVGVTTADPAGGGRLRQTAAMTAPFLEATLQIDGTRQQNFTGALADVFTDVATVGASGASAQELFAVTRAAVSPAVNPGFVRPDAYLLVVYLTAGDDASPLAAEDLSRALKGAKSDPARVMVSAATGACDANGRSAIAAPRVAALLDQFPNRSMQTPICDDDLAPVLALAGELLKTTLGLACLPEPLVDLDPARTGTQPACSVWLTDRAHPADDLVLGSCDDGRAPPCWQVIAKPEACSEAPHEHFAFAPGVFPLPTLAVLDCEAP